MSLWAIMATVTTVATLASLIVAGTLIWLTAILHQTTLRAGAALQSVHLVEVARTSLLLHDRSDDPIVRVDLESRLRRRLTEAREHVSTPEEERLLNETVRRVETYIRADEAGAPDVDDLQHEAYSSLEALVAINLAQSDQAQEEASRWDTLGTRIGMGMSAFLLLAAASLLIWLRVSVIRPVLLLARAMERFGAGDRGARSAESGPAEMREVMRRFNEMASAIAAQREARMAFLGGVAHDLRNPVAVLANSVSVLDAEGSVPPQMRREVIQRMGRQLQRMDRMLGDFLDAAKVEAGQLEVRLETHDLRAIVDRAVESLDFGTGRRRVSLSLPPEPIPMRCDPLRIEQVASNLVANALKYSPEGSPVEVSAFIDKGRAVLRVADRGIGLSDEDTKRIFEPFQRVGVYRGSVPGIGLGLYIVRRIVEAHGGVIEVRSRPNEGSTFLVSFQMLGASGAQVERGGMAP
jgi:signal transduction histidine kinase